MRFPSNLIWWAPKGPWRKAGGAALAGALMVAGLEVSVGTLAAQAAAPVSLNQTWSVSTVPYGGSPIGMSSPGLATLDAGGPAALVGDRGGHVYALHLDDGSPVPGWPANTGGAPIDSTPSTYGGIVFVGVGNAAQPYVGGYYAFNANGSRRWVRTVALVPGQPRLSGVRASLAVGDLQGGPDVVAGSMGQLQYALEAFHGWMVAGFPFFQADSNFSTPALADLYSNGRTEIVEGGASSPGSADYVQYQQGGLIRVLTATGTLLCQHQTDQEVDSSPAVGQFLPGGGVGITVGTGAYWSGATTTNHLLGLDSQCNLKWSTGLDGRTTGSPALADFLGNGSLQVAEGTDAGGGTGSVWLLNGAGQTIWHVAALGAILGGPVSADLGAGYQDLVVATTGGLEVLDGRNGSVLATALHGKMAMENSPLVTNDPNGTTGITVAGHDGYNHGIVVHFEVNGSNGGLVGKRGSWPMFHHDLQLTGDAGTPPPVATCRPAKGPGYWLASAAGQVSAFGGVPYCGSVGNQHLNRPIVATARTPDSGGYWVVAADGRMFSYGDARYYGSPGALSKPIVGMAVTRDGRGYWLVASDGHIFSYGDARYYGSAGRLSKPIVGMAATPDGGGYWLVASSGDVFTFGDAHPWGSIGWMRLSHPIVGMAATREGGGYWLAEADGTIFRMGNAVFHGSAAGRPLDGSIIGMCPSPDDGGYWLASSNGAIYNFGDAAFSGSVSHGRGIVSLAGF